MCLVGHISFLTVMGTFTSSFRTNGGGPKNHAENEENE